MTLLDFFFLIMQLLALLAACSTLRLPGIGVTRRWLMMIVIGLVANYLLRAAFSGGHVRPFYVTALLAGAEALVLMADLVLALRQRRIW